MTKEEFCKRVNIEPEQLPEATYKIIEYIYQFHPMISETEGKDQIAQLYLLGGLPLMKDMKPRAEMHEKLEKDMKCLKDAEMTIARLIETNKYDIVSARQLDNEMNTLAQKIRNILLQNS